MDTPQPFKKRRLNDALHKPFKSPLRTPLKPTSNPTNASNLSSTPLTLSKSASETSQFSENASKSSKSPHARPISLGRATARFSPSTTDNARAKTHNSDTTTATSIRTITAQNKALERQTIQLRQDTDSLAQALSILRANKTAELEELAEKWRGAARLAAEEVFASARDRVNRMGGVGAWREAERERRRRQREFFELEVGDGRGDGEDGGGGDAEDEEERHGDRAERWEYDFRDIEREDWKGEGRGEEEKYQDDEVSFGGFLLWVLLIVIRLLPWI